jgi:putative ABC transport system permease protein
MFAAGFVKQFGNIKLLLLSVGAVVFFTLLLIAGSTMAMSVRERTSEMAVLKALGFSDLRILGLVLSESITYAVLGGGLGIGLAKLFTMSGDPTQGLLPSFYLSPSNIIIGLVIALMIGLISGAMPAINAMRLRVVDALRRV